MKSRERKLKNIINNNFNFISRRIIYSIHFILISLFYILYILYLNEAHKKITKYSTIRNRVTRKLITCGKWFVSAAATANQRHFIFTISALKDKSHFDECITYNGVHKKFELILMTPHARNNRASDVSNTLDTSLLLSRSNIVIEHNSTWRRWITM